MDENATLYYKMLLIRRFEERALAEFSSGKLSGTTHAYIGQEADAAGILSVIADRDVIFSNHRCHGHFLAYGGDPYSLAAELMGKKTGLVEGRGGSQHIHWKNFYSNGIQGGIVPVATGMALAEKLQKSGNIVLVFLGDGTLGEGTLYESMNIASLWKLPILFVLENNQYAQTTPIKMGVAGSISARFSAFGIPTWELRSSDVLEIQTTATEAIREVRRKIHPGALIIHTNRFAAHSKGDDTRSADELSALKQFDPIKIHEGRISQEVKEEVDIEITELINQAYNRAEADPFPSLICTNVLLEGDDTIQIGDAGGGRYG